MKYIVKRAISNDWEVAFHDIDENNNSTPTVFDYPDAAEKEIQSYLEEVKQAVADGHMASSDETRDDFWIAPLDCPSCGEFVEECYPGGVGVLCRKCAVHAVLISEPTHEPRS